MRVTSALCTGTIAICLGAFGASFAVSQERSPSAHSTPRLLDPDLVGRARTIIHKFDQESLSIAESPWVTLHRAYASAGDFDLVVDDDVIPFTQWLETHLAPDAAPVYRNLPLVSAGIHGPEMTAALGRLAHRGFESHLGQFTFLIACSPFDWRSDESPLSESACARLEACAISARSRCLEYIDPSFIVMVALENGTSERHWSDHCDQKWTMNSLSQRLMQDHQYSYPCFGSHRLMALSMIIQSNDPDIPAQTMRSARALRSEALTRAMKDGSLTDPRSQKPAHDLKIERTQWREELHRIGHTLEWVLIADHLWSATERECLRQALQKLIQLMEQRPPVLTDVEYGSLCHGIRALRTQMPIDPASAR